MDAPDKSSDLFGVLKSWISWRSEPANVSRDFWMPDQSCLVCYECDSQFTLFNRRHHCRHCGRIFCANCTSNWVPVITSEQAFSREDCDKIRVCTFCFKQWEQGLTAVDERAEEASVALSNSPSAASFVSTKSNSTITSSCNTFSSFPQSFGSYRHNHPHIPILHQLSPTEMDLDGESLAASDKADGHVIDVGNPSPHQFRYFNTRSYDDDEEFGVYPLNSNSGDFSQTNGYYSAVEFDETDHDYGSSKVHPSEEAIDTQNISNSHNGFEDAQGIQQLIKEEEHVVDECEPSSLYAGADVDAEPVDFENNGTLWLPPDPEDEEGDRKLREVPLFDDDDDDGDTIGEWGQLRSTGSFGSGELRNRDKSNEEHKKVMKNVVDGHFKALVSQLLHVENILLGQDCDQDSWLEIITSLSWEAASMLKPDTSTGGGMDPGGYVKIKCIASGHPYDSVVVKGVVCKKNVAHRRMTSIIEKPRIIILGGALEYQRVSTQLSCFDTLLQQEMDHLKMAVAKIDSQNPDILLVEKSVSRHAQEYLLANDISLVLNIKRPLLERISRCTGSQIIPSVDHLSPQKLGYCDKFHVERFLEEHGSAGQSGKKLVKTLMYFEGCPKPLGCTILLRGANGDVLKKIKHVVQYGVFAAYHLALETSFLADEGASLPELPLNSPITVALPDNPPNIGRSISTVSGFVVSLDGKTQGSLRGSELQRFSSVPTTPNTPAHSVSQLGFPGGPASVNINFPSNSINSANSFPPVSISGQVTLNSFHVLQSPTIVSEEGNAVNWRVYSEANSPTGNEGDQYIGNRFLSSQAVGPSGENLNSTTGFEVNAVPQGAIIHEESSSEAFPPSPSDHQSILVSSSSRCVLKRSVCVKSHLLRIKYYGNSDKPLGRFLRDHLFNQSRCQTCDMPSDAHVHCYTHRQGTLTISVRNLKDNLPGEKEGKIWMWHRCLRCPRASGFPPATKRIVMSDAAWGLSFGKFLELSFSNHAAASRVASCGHSLHRDCLRFYGFGNTVACFRYAPTDVLSVCLPPSKLDFNYEKQDWIDKEMDEVVNQAELLFAEVLNALRQMAEKKSSSGAFSGGMKLAESKRQLADLEVLLQKEKAEFEDSLQKVLNKEVQKGQPVVDILEINRLRRQLLFQSYMWDNRLIHVASLDNNNNLHGGLSRSCSEQVENVANSSPIKSEKLQSSGESLPVDLKLRVNPDQVIDASIFLEQGKDNQTNCQSPGFELPETNAIVHRSLSEGQFPMQNLSDTLDAAWTGETSMDSSSELITGEKLDNGDESLSKMLAAKAFDNLEDSVSWLGMPFLSFYRSLNKNLLGSTQKLDTIGEYNPLYVSSFHEAGLQGGARLLLPVGINETVIPIYDDEPTSIISYALVSPDYLLQLLVECETAAPLLSASSANLPLLNSFDETSMELHRSLGSVEDSFLSLSSSRSSLSLDPLSYTKALHPRISFSDDSPRGKVRYSVTCYYAKRFEALRKICCSSEMDYIRSLNRCKKWGAQGGKSNVFFAKTLDDRFIIKQVTKTELESFVKFAPEYFKYLSESILTGSPTCLAKILGIYQVTSKHVGGKETKMDVLIMENLLFGRTLSRLYDLKGSSRSRYNADVNGSDKVLLDQNLLESMPTSPIFVAHKAKRLLERAVWNDTSFLASIDVMDYSLLVGVDEANHELVVGIIDFMRQYTWDKHLETWVKASGILGGPKNEPPTVISPKQYKKRFRKAMTTYFLMVPDQWSPPTIIPSKSHLDLSEDNVT
ncbi:1-phosphatidylinositol-3-phosphate 5-kinase FAB1B [Impatiens glandulifera]|uniref:1-phosphatidylinositol-3-phosphate 5-kinase FAB1B n=1 Tax=Impatiens glandulifera TaxID=253017 RepID=UPI001FB142FD|nr:1-phosphatidylinositol-3-phosphate 5-kinase FAB1B [Impatiens glandulifera]